ncbi:MAG: cytochrome c3 family protein [bacterium]
MTRTRLLTMALAVAAVSLAAGLAVAKDPPPDPRILLAEEGAEYLGATQCLMCHSDYKVGYLGTKHALTLGKPDLPASVKGCEMCHGPGSLHMANFTNESGERKIVNFQGDTVETFSSVCLDCHKQVATRSVWAGNRHANHGIGCAKCHDPHSPASHENQLRQPKNDLCASCHKQVMSQFKSGISAHPVKQGDFFCVDCHNPHGDNPSLWREETPAETCGRCHEFARQPYQFQHVSEYGDASGRQCLNCHSPHASGTFNLLRRPGRSLCISCHADKVNHNPGPTCWTAGCHSQVHGSNSSALFIK